MDDCYQNVHFHYFCENEETPSGECRGAEKEPHCFSWGLSGVHLGPWGEPGDLPFPWSPTIHYKPNSSLGSYSLELLST